MLGGGTNPRSEQGLFPSPYNPLSFPRAAKGDTPLETPFFKVKGLVFWIDGSLQKDILVYKTYRTEYLFSVFYEIVDCL